jgi:hypothetical protein
MDGILIFLNMIKTFEKIKNKTQSGQIAVVATLVVLGVLSIGVLAGGQLVQNGVKFFSSATGNETVTFSPDPLPVRLLYQYQTFSVTINNAVIGTKYIVKYQNALGATGTLGTITATGTTVLFSNLNYGAIREAGTHIMYVYKGCATCTLLTYRSFVTYATAPTNTPTYTPTPGLPIRTPTPTMGLTHKICSAGTCMMVAGPGEDNCLNSYPDCSHKACSGNTCVYMNGAGIDTCVTNSNCIPSPTPTPTSYPCFSLTPPVYSSGRCDTPFVYSLRLSWNGDPRSTKYLLKIQDTTMNPGSDACNLSGNLCAEVTNTWYDFNYSLSHSYRWTVTSVNSCGQVYPMQGSYYASCYGPTSGAPIFTPTPPIPTGISCSNCGGSCSSGQSCAPGLTCQLYNGSYKCLNSFCPYSSTCVCTCQTY